MKHLYLLVFVLFALTSSHLSLAQMVNTTNPATPISCDGTAFFTLHNSYNPPIWSWHWENDTTQIAGADSILTNLCAGNYSLVLDSLGIPVYTEPFTITDQCSYLTATPSVTNSSAGNCDGSITFIPINGALPMTWEWSTTPGTVTYGTLNNLCPGTYSVTCTDMMGCDVSANVTITQLPPNPLTVSVTYTNDSTTSCSGTASAIPNGGVAPYSYNWSNGQTTSSISGLCAGIYTVYIVDAMLNTATTPVMITNPCSNFTSTISATDCSPGVCDGTVNFMPLNGTAPYTYSWSNGAGMLVQNLTNVCPGTYTVVCTDANGCIDSATATVTDPNIQSNISANLTFNNALTGNCSGSASVAPTGGSGVYSYQWSNGATTSSISNLCPGNYYLLITDSNLDTASVYFTITNPCANFSVFISTTQTIPGNCIGIISASPSGGSYPYTFNWSNGSTVPVEYGLCAGVYTVTCVDVNGCSITQSVTIADSLPGSPLNAGLSLTDDLSADCSGSATAIPGGGFAPYSFYWSNGETTSTIDSLCAGIYSVLIWDATTLDTLNLSFIINDSSSIYNNNPYPNGPINDTLYTDLVTNCIIDYNTIDSASLYQAVYNSSTQSLYVTWAVYSPTDTVYINDTLALIGNPGYYTLTISVFCPNKSGNDFFQIEQVIYFDGSTIWFSTLGMDEQLLDNVTIYPNPFSHSITVDNKDGAIRSMKLIDLNGRVLSERNQVNSGLIEMNQLEFLSNGTYLLILSGENTSKTYKVIK